MDITNKSQYIVAVVVIISKGVLWSDYFYELLIDLHIIWYHDNNHLCNNTLDKNYKMGKTKNNMNWRK